MPAADSTIVTAIGTGIRPTGDQRADRAGDGAMSHALAGPAAQFFSQEVLDKKSTTAVIAPNL
jgi:hypothetical protein